MDIIHITRPVRDEAGGGKGKYMDRIYLDHAATTRLSGKVLEGMIPYFTDCYGNPSSIHATGRDARKAVEQARRKVLAALHAGSTQEIYFTSGGTESDNWAIRGVAEAYRDKGKHIITSRIEHHAVLHTCQWLEKQGWEVTYLPVDAFGRVSPDDVRNAIRKDTVLVSIMMANNEIGTLEPIEEIAEIAHEHGALMHTDAVQAAGAVPIFVETSGADLLSLSAHKFEGPKGMGALYVRKGTRLARLLHGGEQERHMRAGTENVPGMVGLGLALEEATEHLEERRSHVLALRERLYHGICEQLDGVLLNGPLEDRLPGNLNLSFLGIEGESLLLLLDLEGIAASSGSACTAGSLDPSHVLMAIGRSREEAQASLRMTIGHENTEEEIDEVIRLLPGIVRNLRSMRG